MYELVKSKVLFTAKRKDGFLGDICQPGLAFDSGLWWEVYEHGCHPALPWDRYWDIQPGPGVRIEVIEPRLPRANTSYRVKECKL